MYLAGTLLIHESMRAMVKKAMDQTESPSMPGGAGFLILSFLAYANAAWGLILIVAGFIDYARQPKP